MRSYKSNLYVDTFVAIAFYCIYMKDGLRTRNVTLVVHTS